jgi:transcriptional regulator with XRE-family HTH domain
MNLDEYLRRKLEEDPEFRREWEAEEPAIGVRCALIGARRHLGLTQTQLAERMGTTQAYVSRAEADGRASLDFLTRCAAALGGRATLVLELPGGQPASVDAIQWVRRQARAAAERSSSVESETPALVRPRRPRRGMAA